MHCHITHRTTCLVIVHAFEPAPQSTPLCTWYTCLCAQSVSCCFLPACCIISCRASGPSCKSCDACQMLSLPLTLPQQPSQSDQSLSPQKPNLAPALFFSQMKYCAGTAPERGRYLSGDQAYPQQAQIWTPATAYSPNQSCQGCTGSAQANVT